MADFAQSITPRIIDYAQRLDWLGRRILDLGCGTGASMEWLTRRNYVAIGMDESPQMLELCRQRLDAENLPHDVRVGDIRQLNPDVGTMDMVLALDVVNELNSLRDLETLFTIVYKVLAAEKLFVFDMHTIEGLCKQGMSNDQIVYNQSDLTVITSGSYDFERQIQEQRYMLFRRQGDAWQRTEGVRVLRGYPAQAVASLLQRCGFQVMKAVTTGFDDFEPGTSRADRIFILAQKQ
jgi:predicted TPR repeat methyltransferase